MWRNHINKQFVSVLILLTVLLVSCQQQDFPTDNEQLSHEEQIVIRFSHVVGENTPKEWRQSNLPNLLSSAVTVM